MPIIIPTGSGATLTFGVFYTGGPTFQATYGTFVKS